VNFDAQAGEILGIGGLLGSGRSELLLSIFGSEPIFEGEIKIDGETVKPTGPRSMMNSGVALNRPLARSNPFGGSRIR
jgi:rhamnose transport system ATP-binding protein